MACDRISRRGLLPGIQGSARGTLAALASRNQATARAWASELGIPRALASARPPQILPWVVPSRSKVRRSSVASLPWRRGRSCPEPKRTGRSLPAGDEVVRRGVCRTRRRIDDLAELVVSIIAVLIAIGRRSGCVIRVRLEIDPARVCALDLLAPLPGTVEALLIGLPGRGNIVRTELGRCVVGRGLLGGVITVSRGAAIGRRAVRCVADLHLGPSRVG